MVDRVDYNSEKTEKYAQRNLTLYYDEKYRNYVWNGKKDEFDFTCDSEKNILEVTAVLSDNTKKVIEYENALGKGKKPDASLIKDAVVDDNGELYFYYGGSTCECKKNILKAIDSKNAKALRRKEKIAWNHELCLYVEEGGLFHKEKVFSLVLKDFSKWIFSKIFIITDDYIFVISKDNIDKIDKKW